MDKSFRVLVLLLVPSFLFAQVESVTVDSSSRNVLNAGAINYATGQLKVNNVVMPPAPGVTSFSAGNLSPLFTTTVTNSTTTPALSFTLSSVAAGTIFANNTTGSAAPAFVTNPRITAIANLTSNGFVKASGGIGTLSVDTSTYLTSAVTSVATSAPITGGTITGAGTIGLNVGTDFNFSAGQSIDITDAGTTNVPYSLTIGHDSSATPAVNFGTGILWTAKSDTTLGRTIGDESFLWTVVTDATRASKYRIRTVNSGSFVNSATFFPSGGASFNTTTDPGTGYINTTVGYKINNVALSVDDLATTTTNDSALAGEVGQTVSSVITSASALTYTNGQTKNLTSISLTAGDWDVRGVVTFNFSNFPAATIFSSTANIGTTTGTITDDGEQSWGMFTTLATVTGGGVVSCPLPSRRVSLASTTTVYIVGKAPTFTSGACTAFGYIEARRIR